MASLLDDLPETENHLKNNIKNASPHRLFTSSGVRLGYCSVAGTA